MTLFLPSFFFSIHETFDLGHGMIIDSRSIS